MDSNSQFVGVDVSHALFEKSPVSELSTGAALVKKINLRHSCRPN
jgi:hypothetical protein